MGTPIEEFARFLAALVAQNVAASPAKQYVVNRLNDLGKPVQQTATLPQLIAEQNDLLKAADVLHTETNRQYVEMIEVARDLTEALNKNSRWAKKVLDRQEGS